MARPLKNNCDYFPHLTTMRNHKKVKALRNKFGQVLGYAFWAMFIEYLTEQDGCEVENSEIELEMFAGELGVSVTEIRNMVDYCIRIEMLFVNKDNFIFSESLNENLQPVFEKRKQSKEISKTRKRRENGTFIPQIDQTQGVSTPETPQEPVIPDTETPQSRVEYSKLNKIKRNNEFIFFWENYPNKTGKNVCKKKWEILTDEERHEINLRIESYSKYSQFDGWKHPNPETFINQKRWNDESYLSLCERKKTGEEKLIDFNNLLINKYSNIKSLEKLLSLTEYNEMIKKFKRKQVEDALLDIDLICMIPQTESLFELINKTIAKNSVSCT